MSFSIQTNVNALVAQENLRVTNNFQSQTIQRLTSGYRINQSGDDAAGLAVANKFRSDAAELTQGVRNANDGVAQLQIIDGGMNNISKMLDRLKTLATQSASNTFTGDRGVLNSEFQSIITEIDRQAQAIGLNSGGDFAKSLSVFIGGGKTSGGIAAIDNGSVSVDLTQSTVDAKSLGLKGVQASGAATVDLSAGATTSVQNILSNTTNTGSENTSGYTDFYFKGPGFGDSSGVRVSVNLNGVTNTDTLVSAINSAIENAGNGTTAAATAFKNADIGAVKITDSNGERLAFTSASTAFQVQAGDLMANALLGNVTSSADTTGKSLDTTVTGSAATAALAATATAAETIHVRIQGAGMTSAKDLSVSVSVGDTVSEVISSLTSAVADDAGLQAAGISVARDDGTGKLVFTSDQGQQFSVMASGDTANLLGLGSFLTGANNAVDYSTITSTAYSNTANTNTATFQISLNGGASNTNAVTVDLTGGDASAAKVTGGAQLTADLSGATTNLDVEVDGTVYNVDLSAVKGAAADNTKVNMLDIAAAVQTTLGANATVTVGNDGAISIESATKGANSNVAILTAGTADASTVLKLNGKSDAGTSRSLTSVVDELNNKISQDADLQAAGLQATATGGGTTITLASSNNTNFRLTNVAGAGESAVVASAKGQSFTTVDGTSDMLKLSIDGGAAVTIDIGAQAAVNAAAMATAIGNALTNAGATGITVGSSGGHVTFTSSAGSGHSIQFQAVANNAYTVLGITAGATYSALGTDMGFGTTGASFTGNAASAALATSPSVISGGAYQTDALSFSGISFGGESQVITVSANDGSGAQQSQDITLANNATIRNARNIDEAVHAINSALQQSNIGILQDIVAVKVDNVQGGAGTEKIAFASASGAFKVTIGDTTNGGGFTSPGTVTAGQVGDGSTASISDAASAKQAVAALALAVGSLGSAQAAVGRGQNQLSYAINLANSQISNFASAEAQIRDADVAAEAANLTKAQVLQQASMAAMAQANSAPQAVLSLLRG